MTAASDSLRSELLANSATATVGVEGGGGFGHGLEDGLGVTARLVRLVWRLLAMSDGRATPASARWVRRDWRS
jgi:hypothetical protein